jgi:hypothetical protein
MPGRERNIGVTRVGELRPSQVMWAFGPGALVDLPQLSVVVLGLNHWNLDDCHPISESRLLCAVREHLGRQVESLRAVPVRPDTDGPFNPFEAEAKIGVPVATFPRWLRCPICGTLAPYDSGLFDLKPNLYRSDRTKYVHSNCRKAGKPPTAVPARFLVACRSGHLDDFPWHWFVHRGPSDCRGQLRFYEVGASLQTENLWVECTECDKKRSMAEAFGERGRAALPSCRSCHPHLGQHGQTCNEELRPVLLGSSNCWFPVTVSALSIPTQEDKLAQIIEDGWEFLDDVGERGQLELSLTLLTRSGQLQGILEFAPDDIWKVMESRRSRDNDVAVDAAALDMKSPEWRILMDPAGKSDYPDFMVTSTSIPVEFEEVIECVQLVERLREVNALLGFTRIEPPEESYGSEGPPQKAPLATGDIKWVPANEVRGEGIFLQLRRERAEEWLGRTSVTERSDLLLGGYRAWRAARRLEPGFGFPGVLYAMLHTFSHLLIRELSLECGYSAASIRERIYASEDLENPEMAGILLYTAAPDSDGTLGGLVELGKPENLGRLIAHSLERAKICSADPLCSEHIPAKDASLHAAACHACSFVPETSCEAGNRYLDRSLLLPTMTCDEAAFFGDR